MKTLLLVLILCISSIQAQQNLETRSIILDDSKDRLEVLPYNTLDNVGEEYGTVEVIKFVGPTKTTKTIYYSPPYPTNTSDRAKKLANTIDIVIEYTLEDIEDSSKLDHFYKWLKEEQSKLK